LTLFANGLDDPVKHAFIQDHGIIDLDENRGGCHILIQFVEDVIRGLLERLAKLPDQVFDGNNQGKLRLIENFKILKEGLVDLIITTGQFSQWKTRLFEQYDVSLNRPWSHLKRLAQPGCGNLLPFHEDLEDLTQADQSHLRASVTAHPLSPPLL
jgi:hypothetical protein